MSTVNTQELKALFHKNITPSTAAAVPTDIRPDDFVNLTVIGTAGCEITLVDQAGNEITYGPLPQVTNFAMAVSAVKRSAAQSATHPSLVVVQHIDSTES